MADTLSGRHLRFGRAPVAEAEHLFLFGLDALQEGVNAVHAADALQHAQHRLIRASVQRPIQCAHRACTHIDFGL